MVKKSSIILLCFASIMSSSCAQEMDKRFRFSPAIGLTPPPIEAAVFVVPIRPTGRSLSARGPDESPVFDHPG
jgi:hypothetical protein